MVWDSQQRSCPAGLAHCHGTRGSCRGGCCPSTLGRRREPLATLLVQIDKKDADTPDNWVPRDSRILRLTGRHPLNCEPPMEHLMSYGFITPPSIHFVRNHGAAPQLSWKTHRIEINGLVDRPMSISMDELAALPSVTIPVTLVCAGNRRKEENMIKKSIGFNWGPCATSCTYWTGVRLRDLLLHCGIKVRAG